MINIFHIPQVLLQTSSSQELQMRLKRSPEKLKEKVKNQKVFPISIREKNMLDCFCFLFPNIKYNFFFLNNSKNFTK